MSPPRFLCAMSRVFSSEYSKMLFYLSGCGTSIFRNDGWVIYCHWFLVISAVSRLPHGARLTGGRAAGRAGRGAIVTARLPCVLII